MLGCEAYANPVGRIRAMENKLFGKLLLERMLEAEEPSEAIAILAEAGYPAQEEKEDSVKSVRAYIGRLESFAAETAAEVRNFSPEPELFDILLLQSDYHNAKVCIKQELTGGGTRAYLAENGTIPAKKFAAAFRDRNFSGFPELMKDGILQAMILAEQYRAPREAALLLDQIYFEQCYQIAGGAARRETRSFLKEYVEMRADLADILIFFRIRRMSGDDRSMMAKAYLKGGLSLAFFTEAMALAQERLESYFYGTPYRAFVSAGLSNYEATDSMSHFEKLADDYIMQYLSERKGNPFGIEPLYAYITARQREIMNTRMILLGKLNHLQTAAIRQRGN